MDPGSVISTLSTTPETSHGLFSKPVTEQLFIPAPKLFTDIIQKQWINPASLPTPSGMDRRNYNIEPTLANILQVPLVNGLVVAKFSS